MYYSKVEIRDKKILSLIGKIDKNPDILLSKEEENILDLVWYIEGIKSINDLLSYINNNPLQRTHNKSEDWIVDVSETCHVVIKIKKGEVLLVTLSHLAYH